MSQKRRERLFSPAKQARLTNELCNSVPFIRKNIEKHLHLFFDYKVNSFDHINEKIKGLPKESMFYENLTFHYHLPPC